MSESGYVFCCRFGKDKDLPVIFAGTAGRNELRIFDNDSEGTGRYKELGHINDNRNVIMCMDTASNGKQLAWGNSAGQIFVSPYSIGQAEEEPDIRTIQGRIQAKRSK